MFNFLFFRYIYDYTIYDIFGACISSETTEMAIHYFIFYTKMG